MALTNMIKTIGEKGNSLLKDAGENKGALLTVGGILGSVVTTGLTVKGSFKAKDIYDKNKDNMTKEVWIEIGKCYIPSALGLTATIGCIWGAHHEDAAKYAALAALYASDSKKLEDIMQKAKIVEKKEEQKKPESSEKDDDTEPNDVICTDNLDNVRIFDAYLNRFVPATAEDYDKAIFCMNQELFAGEQPSVNDFYDEVFGFDGSNRYVPTDLQGKIFHQDNGAMRSIWSARLDNMRTPYLVFEFNDNPVEKIQY